MIQKFFVLLFVSSAMTFSQVSYEKIFEKNINEISIPLRIDNSGIYCISSFDVNKDTVLLNSFDPKPGELFINNKSLKTHKNNSGTVDNLIFLSKRKFSDLDDRSYLGIKYKRVFVNNNSNVFLDEDGTLTNDNGDQINVIVENRNVLTVDIRLNSFTKNITLSFPNNLACADFIGLDRNRNSFVLVETFLSDIPLKIKREVYVISKEDILLSILEIPSIKYFLTLRDFQIDAEGNLYHLLSEKDKVTIFKWNGLTKNNKGEIFQYPAKYNYSFHFNELLPTDEVEVDLSNITNQPTAVSRTDALQIAEKYVYLKYYCNSNNLAPVAVLAPDGDYVQTPPWLVVGYNATVPYMWGGYSTIGQFISGLSSGKYAGDIHTSGVSSYAVGLDCSGMVSRCWVLPYKYSTSMMPEITTQYSSWDDLKPGDAVHKVGHVRLFVKKNPNGSLKIVEAASRHWNVSYWSFNLSDLTTYTPRYYNGMETNYSIKQPTLFSVIVQSTNQASLAWTSDTSGVKGYRLYKSTDGETWTLFADENTITSTSATITKTNQVEYYRISSVLRDGLDTESDWSNALGSGESSGGNKILIVDGYERNAGGASWQGPGHNFAVRYGKALEKKSLSFDCVKNSLVSNSQINLSDYNAVMWILGDESTVDETFNSNEQTAVMTYLESSGKLFVSGSEIGWDLFYQGSSSDKSFYNNYLKASYISDDANSNSVYGTSESVFSGMNFYIGQTYEEDYPDEITAYGGSTLCLKYSNDKGAGILYSGTFGSSSNTGKIIHFGFPLETTADDAKFEDVISKSADFFFGTTSIQDDIEKIKEFQLSQNYPNPFNPNTLISYQLPVSGNVRLKVYDILGKEVAILVNEFKAAGRYEIEFNGYSGEVQNLASGIYFYQLSAGSYVDTKKMILLR